MKRVDLWPTLLACRQIDQVDAQLAASLGLDPKKHTTAGLVTCDQDDSMYVALDHATKFANVDILFAQSFYAGSRHASGPYSGEILGILAGRDPDEVAEGLWALREALHVVRFETFEGPADSHPAFLAHVIAETGRYLSPQAGIKPGEPMAYLIAPPLEAVLAVDAALKAAPVKLGKWIPPPSETNFAGAFLTGELHHLEAARDAFVEAIASVVGSPLNAARRPDRLRR
jgi:ethanolamine utilization protein EutL